MYHTDDEVTISLDDGNAITVRPSAVAEDSVYFHIARVHGIDKVDGWLTIKEWGKLKQAIDAMLY